MKNIPQCTGDKHAWKPNGSCARCSAQRCVARKAGGARCNRSTTAKIDKRLCGVHRQMALRKQKPDDVKGDWSLVVVDAKIA